MPWRSATDIALAPLPPSATLDLCPPDVYVIGPLRWTDMFAKVAECSHGSQMARGDLGTTKHTKSTKGSEKEAFESIF